MNQLYDGAAHKGHLLNFNKWMILRTADNSVMRKCYPKRAGRAGGIIRYQSIFNFTQENLKYSLKDTLRLYDICASVCVCMLEHE